MHCCLASDACLSQLKGGLDDVMRGCGRLASGRHGTHFEPLVSVMLTAVIRSYSFSLLPCPVCCTQFKQVYRQGGGGSGVGARKTSAVVLKRAKHSPSKLWSEYKPCACHAQGAVRLNVGFCGLFGLLGWMSWKRYHQLVG